LFYIAIMTFTEAEASTCLGSLIYSINSFSLAS
jgi:hypothetical protein